MNGYLKVALFPAVFMVRIYRKIMNLPSAYARRLFAYDRKRFVRWAGAFHADSQTAYIARIIMAYHVLEKGITMPRRHLDFGHMAVLTLMSLIEDFERRFNVKESQVEHAVGCIKEYLSIHMEARYDMTKDREYWNQLKAFCDKHKGVAQSRQIEMSREMFYMHNDAPFPVFAASRHTSRHYEGVVELERIREAVALAMTAPSACNRQFVKVYCVSNHKIRDLIFSLQNGNRGFGADADKLLVVTADLSGNRWAEERNDLYTNAGIFVMNLCYALHYYKVAHCILNWSVAPKSDRVGRRLLRLPDNEVITVLISCGNAPAEFLLASSPRKSIQDVFAEIK